MNFVDRRGDFEKWCVSLVPVVENASPPKSSKNDEFMTILIRKMGQPHTERTLFFNRGPVWDIRRLRSRLKHFSDLSRTRLGVICRIVAKSCNFALGVLASGPIFADRRDRLKINHRACRQKLGLIWGCLKQKHCFKTSFQKSCLEQTCPNEACSNHRRRKSRVCKIVQNPT